MNSVQSRIGHPSVPATSRCSSVISDGCWRGECHLPSRSDTAGLKAISSGQHPSARATCMTWRRYLRSAAKS